MEWRLVTKVTDCFFGLTVVWGPALGLCKKDRDLKSCLSECEWSLARKKECFFVASLQPQVLLIQPHGYSSTERSQMLTMQNFTQTMTFELGPE